MSQYWPWSPGWGFSTVNLLFSFLSMLSSLEGSLCVHLIFKEWEIVYPFLKGGVPILWNKWSGIVLYGRLIYSSVSIYLYSQLFISARTQGYSFILWVTLQYYFILLLNCSSFGHWDLFHWLLCRFEIHLPVWGLFLSTFLLYGTHKTL